MKPQLLLILLAGLFLAADDPKDEAKEKAVKDEMKKLEGNWTVTQMERSGQKLPDDRVRDLTFVVVFKGDQMTAKAGGATTEATCQIDPSKQPKTIDTTDKAKKLERGIYKLDGDLLTICTAVAGGERPTEFATKAGTDQLLFVLKKVKQ